MTEWKTFDDELPRDGEVIEIADHACRARLAVFCAHTRRVRILPGEQKVRSWPDLWRAYKPPVAPTALEIDRADFTPTKTNDEPGFTLVARDPVAAPLIEAWANMRMGQMDLAHLALDRALRANAMIEPQRNDDPQILSAFRVAGEMRRWLETSTLRRAT